MQGLLLRQPLTVFRRVRQVRHRSRLFPDPAVRYAPNRKHDLYWKQITCSQTAAAHRGQSPGSVTSHRVSWCLDLERVSVHLAGPPGKGAGPAKSMQFGTYNPAETEVRSSAGDRLVTRSVYCAGCAQHHALRNHVILSASTCRLDVHFLCSSTLSLVLGVESFGCVLLTVTSITHHHDSSALIACLVGTHGRFVHCSLFNTCSAPSKPPSNRSQEQSKPQDSCASKESQPVTSTPASSGPSAAEPVPPPSQQQQPQSQGSGGKPQGGTSNPPRSSETHASARPAGSNAPSANGPSGPPGSGQLRGGPPGSQNAGAQHPTGRQPSANQQVLLSSYPCEV